MKLGKYVIGLLSGLTFGMLFAQKKGKDLRKELFTKTSESGTEGLKVLGSAFKGAGEEAWKELRAVTEHEDVAALLELSQERMRGFLDTAEEKGYDVASFVQEKLEMLAGLAKEKVEELKGDAGKSAAKKAIFVRKKVAKAAAKVKKHVKEKLE